MRSADDVVVVTFRGTTFMERIPPAATRQQLWAALARAGSLAELSLEGPSHG